ncbi:hypothetical protein EUGRSUZ_H02727 [Eucalyptus grandis]|uniref:Uncharacterized protein n=2 Tax=Eucalyptus grandis TaxID=71139 RepID=A0ACC3JSE0_EUCGR|nr:hypothetical protein EUGRSUZ_H02727 [Eucalyptus grandis]
MIRSEEKEMDFPEKQILEATYREWWGAPQRSRIKRKNQYGSTRLLCLILIRSNSCAQITSTHTESRGS